MRTIATLGPSVRLVVFQFLMKSAQVPRIVPLKRDSDAPTLLPPVPGVMVLPSTPKLYLSLLASYVLARSDYELVDVWQNPHATKWDMSFVRFVFCHNEHVRRDELFPDFVAKKDRLEEVLINLVHQNLWATQGYLNPYFEKDGTDSGHKVLMLGSAGRVPNDMVFSGGRDENNRGVGPKVPLSTLSSRLDMMMLSDEVVLMDPTEEPNEEPDSISYT